MKFCISDYYFVVIIAMRPLQSNLRKDVLHSQTREVVAKVRISINEKKQKKVLKIKAVLKAVIAALGVSKISICRINKEINSIQPGESCSFSTPNKEKNREDVESALDSFSESVICRTLI